MYHLTTDMNFRSVAPDARAPRPVRKRALALSLSVSPVQLNSGSLAPDGTFVVLVLPVIPKCKVPRPGFQSPGPEDFPP